MTEPVIVAEVQPHDEGLLAAIVALADRNRRTLGLMPRSAFGEFAARGRLLVAQVEGGLAGYALYEVARRRVRLTHLCVSESHRGRGVARRLVAAISDKHGDLAGILVKCRLDYPAHGLWPVLGFEPKHETPGRGKDGATLIHWWRDHGIPDLFTASASDEVTVVAIDHNVFIDLAVERARPGAEESRALEADWLEGLVQLAVTRETSYEILKNPDEQERSRQRKKLGQFDQLSYGPAAEHRVKAAWHAAVGTPPDEDESDCRHILGAAAGGVRVFVTRDEKLISRYAEPAADVFGLRILRPSDLIAHLDEVANAAKYRPVDLNGTGFSVSAYGADAEADLLRFLNQANGERKNDYRRQLRDAAADPTARRQWVREPTGGVVAAWVTRPALDDRTLEVPVLRVDERSPLGLTLGRLIALEIKQQALAASRNVVHISDPFITRGLAQGLRSDGFQAVRGVAGLLGAVLDVRSTDEVLRAVEGTHPLRDMVSDAIGGGTTIDQVASLERTLWPAKLLDTHLSNWVVPIRPAWADQLLGANLTLWQRPAVLGISRELVYYHAPRNNPPVPARIAWYASGTGPRGVGAVVAVSLLVAVDTDTPVRLHRRYQHLGVYRLDDVKASARHNGRASALRFIDTEVLARPIRLERMRELAGIRALGTLQSATMITSSLFGQVYREGTGRDT